MASPRDFQFGTSIKTIEEGPFVRKPPATAHLSSVWLDLKASVMSKIKRKDDARK